VLEDDVSVGGGDEGLVGGEVIGQGVAALAV
jgi:hypothetical protein